jgi:endonuclease YncB( thermonuclease family)
MARRVGSGLAVFAVVALCLGAAYWLPNTWRATASQSDAHASPPRIGDEGVLDGRVTWVTDGDSLRVLINGRDMEIRLSDVDAPEREQPYGWQAKLELIDLVRDRHVVLKPRDVDRYGRVVARVWAGDTDVNKALVRRGAAWFYSQYAKDESLYYAEQEAREAKAGLWSLPVADRVEPWHWRARARQSTSGRSQQ